jgi:hypothetical protein
MPDVIQSPSWTVTLGGIPLQVVPDPSSEAADDAAYSGEYLPQESSRATAKRDVPVYLSNFSRGAGFMEMRDETDAGGLAWAEDGFTHLGNGLMPSGRRTARSLSNILTKTDVAITDSRIFNGDLWAITTGGVVIRFPNADPTASPVFSPALNAFGSATNSLRAGYVCKAIEVFATRLDGAGAFDAGGLRHPALYVTAYNASIPATRIYQFTATFGWVESAAFTSVRADKAAVCWWEGRDGVGAQRLHVQSADAQVRHCIYGQNPLAEASYVTPIDVGNPGTSITRLLAAPTHLWVGKTDGWHDVNEIRSANITPYWQADPTYANGQVAMLYDQLLLAGRRFGVDAYDTRQGELGQQRMPGECGPGLGWQDGSPVRGQITGMAQHDGAALFGLWNDENRTSYVGRAYARERLNVDVSNPLVHYWAEQVIKPTSGVGQQITHMTVAAPSVSFASTIGSLSANLWMFTADVPTGAGFTFSLYYARMPVGSGPLSLQASGGEFVFNSPARFYFTAQTWGDRNALKAVRRYDLVSRNTTDAQTIELLARADGNPATITNQGTWTSQGVHNTTANVKSIIPSAVTTGNSIALQAILTTPSAFVSAPILHEISVRAAVRRETFKVRYLWVVLERDHGMVSGPADIRSPDAVFDSIASMQQLGYQTFVNEAGDSETVLLEQSLRFSRGDMGDGVWRSLMRLELSKVSA